ncbi:nucleoside recognition domain-containing protein [Thalassobacillus sp. CUG 92003]|uniref:nucleoside recognition domain-containing protein n=1 Tax=Thalassobacillus sp. CUG 92003 TaxID=2736641 RepID=UPI0015E730FF|nr:nucleoside recognition domain-containing protein [Thalassobacillus sp. CUG 92003]
MINVIWAMLAVIGIVYAGINGTMAEVNRAIFQTIDDSVMITLSLMGVLIFWLGLMKVAEEAGLLRALAKAFRPIVTRLFPDIPRDDPAMGYILSNMTANMLGLGNAATPMGIKAMKEMKRLSGSDEASRSMITFLALNTSSLTLIPTTVIAIRMKFDSAAPTEIISSTLIATAISTMAAILIDRYFYYQRRKKERHI